MTVAYVTGMQGDDPRYLKVVGTLKHFAMNNQEEGRHTLSAEVDERWMHEYYLRPYRAGIVEGGAQSIMSIYNKLNEVPGAANSWLMTEVLRDMWGFDGFGVPDSRAIENLVDTHAIVETYDEAAATAVLAGHDVDEGGMFPDHIVPAVEQGLITEDAVDRAVRRVLTVRMRLGEFDPPEMVPYNDLTFDIVKSAPHRELALETARQSIVLLSNDAGILPLDRDAISSIAVIGPHADYELMGIGYTGQSDDFVVPLEGIQNSVAPGTEVIHVRGSDIMPNDENPESGYVEAEEAAAAADAAVVVVGTSSRIESEGNDREFLNLMPNQQELVERVLAANPNTAVVLVNAGPLSLTGGRPGTEVPTAVMAFMAGEEGGTAIAEVLFGDYNPGGRLPYTVYYSADDVPGWEEYDISQGYTYMYFEGEPEWPFGHGLSYTTFEYSGLDVSPAVEGSGELTVSVDVRNTGDVTGDEVVQLYVRDLEPRLARPRQWLVAFERITLEPGETQLVTLTAPARELSFYDVDQGRFVVEPGPYEAFVGSSSADIRQTGAFEVTSAGQFPR
jgi:beta-glucosidase